jgi:hypothetical protein
MKNFSFRIGALEVVARVYLNESRDLTARYRRNHGAEYLFVAGEILVMQGGQEALLANREETYNAQVWLSEMEKQLRHPFDITALLGNGINVVSEWMVSYWDDVQHDRERASDATLYDELKSTLQQSDSRQGILAIYRSAGKAYIDCAAKLDKADTYTFQQSQFDTLTAANSVDDVRRRIASYVQA